MPEQIAFGLLRFAASTMVLVGVCSLIATLPLLGIAATSAVVSAFLRAAIVVGFAFLAAGIAAKRFARSNPRTPQSDASGGRIFLALALTVIPAVMLARLGPLAALWSEAFVLMERAKVWDILGRGADFSAIVLAPVAAALIVPVLAVVTALAFVGGSLTSLIVIQRSRTNLTRAYASALLMQAALVLATMYGGSLAHRAGDAIEGEIQRLERPDSRTESADMLDRMRRYDSTLRSSAATLAWTLGAYAVVLFPLLLASTSREAASASSR